MKRAIDFILSLIMITVLSPLFLVLTLWIKKDSPGSVLFKQNRTGTGNKIFQIYKFRSMRTDTPNVASDLLGDTAKYITKSGRFIRKTSLDELPQLFNILRGDMSFVGPRPALYNQYELIEERTKRNIHTIRPGLTGYAQVMGRDNISDEEKVAYDEYYLKNQSLLLDTKIFVWTFVKVLRNEDVSH